MGVNGICKVAPVVKTQEGGTCIYNAICSTMESHLRLNGYCVRLSVEDLIEKEQALVCAEEDRTLRCIEVAKTLGVCSHRDYQESKRKGTGRNGSTFKILSIRAFLKLNADAFADAIESWGTNGPLLAEIDVDETFMQYIIKFEQAGILSYEAYNEINMRVHAACVLALGVENVVPFWEFINSYGKLGKTKGYGRVVPHNVRRLFEIVVEVPKKRVRGIFENTPSDSIDTQDLRPSKGRPPVTDTGDVVVPVLMGAAAAAGNAFPTHTMDWAFSDPPDGYGSSAKPERLHMMDID
uniref:Peptidase C1A papain C-terminal domain-containing protein n=1 Tax=Oryza rufipogon TaxID=4529 RepID=A0A0E0PQS1_ORYRU